MPSGSEDRGGVAPAEDIWPIDAKTVDAAYGFNSLREVTNSGGKKKEKRLV